MRKLFALVAALGLCVTVSACGNNACEDAVDKTVACLEKMDCKGEALCEAMKKTLKTAADQYGGQDCSGQAETWAKETNKCTLDPQTCACPQ